MGAYPPALHAGWVPPRNPDHVLALVGVCCVCACVHVCVKSTRRPTCSSATSSLFSTQCAKLRPFLVSSALICFTPDRWHDTTPHHTVHNIRARGGEGGGGPRQRGQSTGVLAWRGSHRAKGRPLPSEGERSHAERTHDVRRSCPTHCRLDCRAGLHLADARAIRTALTGWVSS